MNLIHILDALSSYWSAFLCVNCGNGFNVGYINCDPSQGTSFRTNDNSVWVCRIHSYRSSKGSNKLQKKLKTKNQSSFCFWINTNDWEICIETFSEYASFGYEKTITKDNIGNKWIHKVNYNDSVINFLSSI